MHVPFPDGYDIRENTHSLSVVVVVDELDPLSTFTIDAVTRAGLELWDETVIELNVRDPFEMEKRGKFNASLVLSSNVIDANVTLIDAAFTTNTPDVPEIAVTDFVTTPSDAWMVDD